MASSLRKANTLRFRNGHPLHIIGGFCRNQVWFGIFALFAIWCLLLFLNYSSLILSVQSLTNFYVNSVNQHDSVPLRSTFFDSQTSPPHAQDPISNADLVAISLPDDINNKPPEADHIDIFVVNNNITDYPFDVADHIVDLDGARGGGGDGEIANKVTPPPPPPLPPAQSPPPPKRRQRRRGKKRGKGMYTKPIVQVEAEDTSQVIHNSVNQPVERNPNKEPPPPPLSPVPPRAACKVELKSNPRSCAGRYIYVHILPRKYHVDLLRDCNSLDLWMDMCQYVKNSGMGPPLSDLDRAVFSESGWFATNQFLLEVIFHNRMKQYDCLTNDSAQATAVFVPFYAGLDVARHLWNSDSRVRDDSAFELIKWLKRKPEWGRFSGRDHFLVGGRITWDFRRSENHKDPDWGTKFLYLPEARNMTALVIESSPWHNNDFGIPYPTYFHPSSDDEVFTWQARMRTRSRKYLFSFAGAPRPDRPDSIRNQLITQCRQCNMVECNNWKNKCHKPAELMKVFQDSYFCLQPPGDSYTRRSTFDSIVAGCIPVFFHPGSAYAQYYWHFPRDYRKYSVFISMYEVEYGKVSVEGVLGRISQKKVEEMKEQVVRLIPRVVYADPRCKLETLNDAFDVAVDGVLERIGRIKEDMRVGRNESFAYDETQAWKYEWLGRLEEHQWDPYFSGRFDHHNLNLTNFG
ncbi:hypothetical protein V2J09_007443 [Rumex salicifolius]